MAKKPETKAHSIAVERSSGNVFADLGLAEPEELKTKVILAVRLNERIEALNRVGDARKLQECLDVFAFVRAF